MSQLDTEELFPTDKIARLFHVTPQTVRTWIKRGLEKRRGPRILLTSREAVLRFFDNFDVNSEDAFTRTRHNAPSRARAIREAEQTLARIL